MSYIINIHNFVIYIICQLLFNILNFIICVINNIKNLIYNKVIDNNLNKLKILEYISFKITKIKLKIHFK